MFKYLKGFFRPISQTIYAHYPKVTQSQNAWNIFEVFFFQHHIYHMGIQNVNQYQIGGRVMMSDGNHLNPSLILEVKI